MRVVVPVWHLTNHVPAIPRDLCWPHKQLVYGCWDSRSSCICKTRPGKPNGLRGTSLVYFPAPSQTVWDGLFFPDSLGGFLMARPMRYPWCSLTGLKVSAMNGIPSGTLVMKAAMHRAARVTARVPEGTVTSPWCYESHFVLYFSTSFHALCPTDLPSIQTPWKSLKSTVVYI